MAVAGAGDWEVIGWTTATLIGSDQWRLSGLLRGMLQTEAIAIEAGAKVVIINDRLRTISLPPHQVGVPLLWQIGPRETLTYTYIP